VLGVRASVEAFAYYSVPYNGVLRLSLIGAAAGMVLLPRVTAEMAAGATAEALRLTRVATRLLAATMLCVLIPLIAVTPELLRLWVGAEFASRSSLAARLLMVSIFANVLARPPLAVIQGRAHPITLVWVYAGELAFHFPLTLLLVGRFGIAGAGAAWGVRAVIDAGVLRVLAGRTLGSAIGEERVIWGGTTALAALVALVTLAPLPVWARLLGAAAAAALAFFALLDRGERATLLDSVVMRARGGAADSHPTRAQVGVPDPEDPEASL
jgi:O-antigen/teichoic acid export membrane protein